MPINSVRNFATSAVLVMKQQSRLLEQLMLCVFLHFILRVIIKYLVFHISILRNLYFGIYFVLLFPLFNVFCHQMSLSSRDPFIYFWNIEFCHNILVHDNKKACIYFYIFIEKSLKLLVQSYHRNMMHGLLL